MVNEGFITGHLLRYLSAPGMVGNSFDAKPNMVWNTVPAPKPIKLPRMKGQFHRAINQSTRSKNKITSTTLREYDYERLRVAAIDIKFVLVNAKMEHDQVFYLLP
jgi:hypothetical protein